MSDPIKTTLLKTLEALLQGLLGVASLKRDWQFPLDLGAVDALGNPLLPLPALLFYEDEERPGLDNLLAENELDLDLVLFDAFGSKYSDESSPGWQSFKDRADAVAAYIHNLLQARSTLDALAAAGLLRLEERGPNRKAACNDDYGEMVLFLRLTYGHRLGDAFSLNLN